MRGVVWVIRRNIHCFQIFRYTPLLGAASVSELLAVSGCVGVVPHRTLHRKGNVLVGFGAYSNGIRTLSRLQCGSRYLPIIGLFTPITPCNHRMQGGFGHTSTPLGRLTETRARLCYSHRKGGNNRGQTLSTCPQWAIARKDHLMLQAGHLVLLRTEGIVLC